MNWFGYQLFMPFKTDAQRKRVMGYEIGRSGSLPKISSTSSRSKDSEESDEEIDEESDEDAEN